MSLATDSNPIDSTAARFAINAPWLVKLRWVALVGQLATVAIVFFGLGIPLPLAPLATALAVTAITNIALGFWVSHVAHEPGAANQFASLTITGVMLLDLAVLTSMLYVTGGATNPFMVFYLVNLALAGVLLAPRWAWLLEAVAVAGMALLYWRHWQVPVLRDPARLAELAGAERLPLAAMGDFVAFAACSGVIVAFMTRLTSELQQSDEARRLAEERRARSEKLEALGTLAAGAAHELATPLSTIAVVATEVERELANRHLPSEITADLHLIRSELARCRAILDRMAVDSGQATGEAPSEISVAEFIKHVVQELGKPELVRVEIDDAVGDLQLRAPRIALAQALRGLVQNGLDAAPSDTVQFSAHQTGRSVQLTITDRGPGMTSDVLARAGEPFFTTKQPGQGMGLGLFLARSVIERLGGTLKLESPPGQGARAVVELPVLK